MDFMRALFGLVGMSGLVALGSTIAWRGAAGHPLGPSPIAFVLNIPNALRDPLLYWLWPAFFVLLCGIGIWNYIRARH